MGAAIAVAQVALANGELPIGAVVAVGDEIVARAHTSDVGAARRLAHAETLALTGADGLLRWKPRKGPVRLATTIVPAITGRVRRVECRDLYRWWCEAAPSGSGFRPFAETMAGLPDVA